MKRNSKFELKLLLFFVLCLLISAKKIEKSLLELNTNLAKKQLTNLYDKFSYNTPNTMRFKSLQPNCVKLKGWLKYLQISEESLNVPSSFIKNKMFFVQMNANPNLNTKIKDQKGNYINIPSEEFFWVSMVGEELNISTARNKKYSKCENKLFLKDLVKQDSTSPCQGGVEDMGNFSEGYCFMLKFIVGGKHHLWELCAESELLKDSWMQCIISKKKKSDQKKKLGGLNGISLGNKDCNKSGGKSKKNKAKSNKNCGNTPNLLKNGWVPKTNWSNCSKKCGPGKQTRKLKCMKKNKKCKGSNKQERMCEIQKCKDALKKHMDNLTKVSEGKWEFLGKWSPCSKPCGGGKQMRKKKCSPNSNCKGIKVEKKSCNVFACKDSNFNKKSYSPCNKLEGNLKLNNNQNSHIIVDMDHIDVFTDHLMLHPVYSVSLGNIAKMNVNKSNNCLNINDKKGGKATLCGDKENDCTKWKKKIKNFKKKCNKNKGFDDMFGMKGSNPSNMLKNLSTKVLEEEKKQNKKKEAQLMNKFEQFKKQINDLLENEEKLEKKIENEQRKKMDKEKESLKKLVNAEQKKSNDLVSQLQQLGKGDTFKAKERAIKRKMKIMMEDIKKKISQKRKNLKNKLKRMKKLHSLEKKKAAKKLLNIKKKMGKKLSNMNKKGDPNKCFKISTNKDRCDYCQINYKDNFLNEECKNPSQFCYMCCDMEVGKINKENLNCCYNKCDKIKSNKCDKTFGKLYHLSAIHPHLLPHHHHLVVHSPLHPHPHAHHLIHQHLISPSKKLLQVHHNAHIDLFP